MTKKDIIPNTLQRIHNREMRKITFKIACDYARGLGYSSEYVKRVQEFAKQHTTMIFAMHETYKDKLKTMGITPLTLAKTARQMEIPQDYHTKAFMIINFDTQTPTKPMYELRERFENHAIALYTLFPDVPKDSIDEVVKISGPDACKIIEHYQQNWKKMKNAGIRRAGLAYITSKMQGTLNDRLENAPIIKNLAITYNIGLNDAIKAYNKEATKANCDKRQENTKLAATLCETICKLEDQNQEIQHQNIRQLDRKDALAQGYKKDPYQMEWDQIRKII